MWRLLTLAMSALAVAVLLGACDPSQAEPQGEPPQKRAFEAAEQARQAAAEAGPHAPKHPEFTPIPTTPSPTPFVAGPDVRPCDAADLNAGVTGSNGLTGGQALAGIGLGNESAEPCRLSGPPGIELLGPDGGVIPLDVFQSPPCSDTTSRPCIFPGPLLMLPNLGEVKPHSAVPGQGWLEITWRGHDDTGTCSPQPRVATAVRLSLPEGRGELTVDLTSEFPATPQFPAGIAPCQKVGILEFGGVPPKG